MTVAPPEIAPHPYDRSGVIRGEDGIARYQHLPTSLPMVLRDRADRHPDAEAVVAIGGARLSYRQLLDGAARVAGGLRDLGVEPGDRVAILLPAGNDWVLGFFGAILCGAIAVPVNTRLTDHEIGFVLEDTGVRHTLRPGSPMPDGEPHVAEPPGHRDPAAIFYTSGTTGKPKGAVVTHEGLLTNAENAVRTFRLDRTLQPAELRTLISVPLFHVTGCNSQLIVALYTGGTAVILPALDVGAALAAVATERINLMITVPAVFALMIRHPEFGTTDVSSVRWIGYGGAPTPPGQIRRIREGFPTAQLFHGFGSTETSSLTSVLPDEDAEVHADSVGYPVPVADVGLADEDKASGVGELLVRSPTVTPGYWNRPDATAETIRDGWLHTGDLARI